MTPERPCNGTVKRMVEELEEKDLDRIFAEPVVKELLAKETRKHRA